MLDAALDCFLQRGVVDTTVDEILQKSGASVGSLYHHFGGKEQLADALFAECLAAYHSAALARLEAAPNAEHGVRSIVEHHLDWIESNTASSQFVVVYRDHELRPASPQLRELNHHFFGALERWLVTHAVAPIEAPLPTVISQWLGPVRSFARHWLTGNVAVAPAGARRFLSDAAWQSLHLLFTSKKASS